MSRRGIVSQIQGLDLERDQPVAPDEFDQEPARMEAVPIGCERDVDLPQQPAIAPVDEAARVAVGR